MKLIGLATEFSCGMATALFGRRGCESCVELTGATVKILNKAFDTDVHITYSERPTLLLENWFPRFDSISCAHLSRFIEDNMGILITTAEILECETVFQLSVLIDSKTMYFYPSKCGDCPKNKLHL